MTQDEYVHQINEEILKLKHILQDVNVRAELKSTASQTLLHLQELLRDVCQYTIQS